MERLRTTHAPVMDAQLRARGATVTHFRGRTVYDVGRPPGEAPRV
jgi:hypothetical protein